MEKDMIFLLVLLTAGALTLLCFWLDRRLRKARARQQLTDAQRNEYQQQLLDLERQLAAGQEAPPVSRSTVSEGRGGFAGSLQQAGLRIRLQQQQQGSGGGVAERYRLVISMAKRGLSAADISAILKRSVSEIQQLLKLLQLTRQVA